MKNQKQSDLEKLILTSMKNEDVFYSIHMLNVFSFQMLKTKQPIGQFDLNSIKLKGYNYIVRK